MTTLMAFAKKLLAKSCVGKAVMDGYKPTVDIPSPRDIIPNENVIHFENQNCITIRLHKPNLPINREPDVWLTTVADTNSMDAMVDYGHTCILIKGQTRAEHRALVQSLRVGDVVVYTNGTDNILHRIIEITTDEQGRKYKLKGDNNWAPDPYIIRDAHILWLLIGVIY